MTGVPFFPSFSEFIAVRYGLGSLWDILVHPEQYTNLTLEVGYRAIKITQLLVHVGSERAVQKSDFRSLYSFNRI